MQLSHDDLAQHFPDKAERIQALRLRDPKFHKLCENYAEVNRAIQRRATDAVYTGRQQAQSLRRTREMLQQAINESIF